MRRRHYSHGAIDGTLHIRSLGDEQVLAAARNQESDAHRAILKHLGTNTNPSWITGRCAEEAYERGLIGEREFDYLFDQ
ncbi:hypothetical protein E1091_00280 [Micromonospora fluostatini]|uniref:Uncharacterized protein n=2 Tax=Micromonospora TaxID=1873 RepID=A0ABY2DS64_9ACTN|nr:hypothetical protein E1091_00280 [Micromonospora fluostatini]